MTKWIHLACIFSAIYLVFGLLWFVCLLQCSVTLHCIAFSTSWFQSHWSILHSYRFSNCSLIKKKKRRENYVRKGFIVANICRRMHCIFTDIKENHFGAQQIARSKKTIAIACHMRAFKNKPHANACMSWLHKCIKLPNAGAVHFPNNANIEIISWPILLDSVLKQIIINSWDLLAGIGYSS